MNMAGDGRVRKLHRRDWPGFLNRVVPSGVWQTFSRDAPTPGDPRVRWRPKYILLTYVAMGWSMRRRLRGRFDEARQWIVDLFPNRRRPGNTFPGLTMAATGYDEALFQAFWASLRRTIPSRLRDSWRLSGWIVFGVDGSRDDAARTRSNEAALGRSARDKSHPQWWMTWLVHLPTLLLWDWRQGPGTASERGHMSGMKSSLPADALVVADAGFGGFDFLCDLVRSGAHFLFRCGGNTTLLTANAATRIIRNGETSDVYLWPKNRRRHPPLALRLIVLKRGGKRVYLLTNVRDTKRLSRKAAGEIYHLRWGVETNYRDFKQTMERRKVLSGTPECGALELAGNIVAMGLLRLQAAIMQTARGARISVAKVLDLLRRAMEYLRHGIATQWFVDALKTAVTDDYQRKRRKDSRDWPRKKRQRPPSPPKLRRLGKRELDMIQARISENPNLFA